jgi:hypothetical protein
MLSISPSLSLSISVLNVKPMTFVTCALVKMRALFSVQSSSTASLSLHTYDALNPAPTLSQASGPNSHF